MSEATNPAPPKRKRSSRMNALLVWALSLAVGALLPLFGLAGWPALLISLLVLVASIAAAGVVAFVFRHALGHARFFVAGVALFALFSVLLNATMSAGDALLLMQVVASVVALLVVDLLAMTCVIGVWLVWLGRGGGWLLVAGSLAALWLPPLAARLTGIEAAIDGMLGLGGQANVIGMAFCGALCVVPVALLIMLSRLLRGVAHEISDATPANPQ